jgi:hypothetical protein
MHFLWIKHNIAFKNYLGTILLLLTCATLFIVTTPITATADTTVPDTSSLPTTAELESQASASQKQAAAKYAGTISAGNSGYNNDTKSFTTTGTADQAKNLSYYGILLNQGNSPDVAKQKTIDYANTIYNKWYQAGLYDEINGTELTTIKTAQYVINGANGLMLLNPMTSLPALGGIAVTNGIVNGTQVVQESNQLHQQAQDETVQNEPIWCLQWSAPYINPAGCVAKLAYVFLGFCSWVLWVAGVFFNYIIDWTLNIKSFVDKLGIITLGWTTFRDFANLFFVFIILYIAINTILGNSSYGIKTLLGKVVIAAILINFSLFFTNVIIDSSNIVALQFYSKIMRNSGGSAAPSNVSFKEYDGGISGAIASAMGLYQVWQIGRATENTQGKGDESVNMLALSPGNLIVVGFAGGIFILITAVVFFAGGLMFLFRTITLLFVMILSPFAFLGGILPSTKKYASEWWDTLIKNAMFAPAYMALLYLVVSMVLGGGLTSQGSFLDIFSGNAGYIDVLANFFVLNALMVGCIIIAKKLGASGASWATNTAKAAVGMAAGGSLAFLGRNTLGRLANAYTKSEMGKNPTNSFGRLMSRTMSGVANSSFDARNVGGVGKKFGIGGGDTRGIKGRIKDRNEARKESVLAESELYGTKGKTALASRRQGGWFKGTREGGDAVAKKALEDEATKQREILNDLINDPDYKDFTKLVEKSQSNQGLTATEISRAQQLQTKLNRKVVPKLKQFTVDPNDSTKNKWEDNLNNNAIVAGFNPATGTFRIAYDAAKELATHLNEHNRNLRTKGFAVEK